MKYVEIEELRYSLVSLEINSKLKRKFRIIIFQRVITLSLPRFHLFLAFELVFCMQTIFLLFPKEHILYEVEKEN